MDLTFDTFQKELDQASRNFDKFVVCLDKSPEECREALHALMKKAIEAYLGRAPNLRHGIALDRRVTIILSQTETELPLCGIYFNLHSPYRQKAGAKLPEEG
jgi:hypothetical protein